jgi:hypothetical protein
VINEQLQPLAVPIDSLNFDPRNARTHDERNLDAIKESLQEYGQQKPIVVNTEGEVIAGNGTLMAAKSLGWKEIAAVCYDGTGDEDAFGIADNRTGELAKWDYRVLGTKLRTLKDDGFDIKRLGWKDYELEPLLAAEWKPPKVSDDDLLPDKDKGGGENIKVTMNQYEVIVGAIAKVRNELEDNNVSEGRCLELICADFLSGEGLNNAK